MVPRFRIAWGMAFVALTAFDFGAIRAWSHLRVGHDIAANGRSLTHINNTCDELFIGSLPMVNVLSLVLLLGQRRLARFPFLLGFAAFGLVALGVFMALAYFYTEALVQPYVLWFLRLKPLQTFAAHFSPGVRPPIFFCIAMLLVGLPQLAFLSWAASSSVSSKSRNGQNERDADRARGASPMWRPDVRRS